MQDSLDEIDEIGASILQTIQEPAFIVDGKLHIKMANQPCREILHLKDEEIVGRTLETVINGWSHSPDLGTHLRNLIAHNQPLEKFTLNLSGLSNVRRTASLNARRVRPTTDIILVTVNIADTDDVNEALRIEEERFRVALKNSHIVTFNQDTDLRYTWVYNDPAGLPMNLSNKTTIGYTDADIFDPDTAAKLTKIKRKVLETGQGTREEMMFVRGGDKIYRDLTIEPLHDALGRVIGITGAAADITDRKIAEAAMRESEEWFSKAFHLSPAPMTIVSVKDRRIIEVNRSEERLSGFSREEIIGRTSAELNTLRNSEERSEIWADLEQGKSVHDKEVEIYTKSGEIRHGLASFELVTIGSESYVLGLMQDITERKKVEEALRQSEERFSKVFHASSVAKVIQTLRDQRILDVNESMERLTGYGRDQLIGHTATELNLTGPTDMHTKFWENLNDFKPIYNQEASFRTRHGEVRDVLVSADIISLDGQPRVLSTILDITERKHADKQAMELALEREKQHILEQLLLTASHDLRTPISAVSVTAYLLNKLADKMILQYANLRLDPANVLSPGQAALLDEINVTLTTLRSYIGRMDNSADRLKHLVEKMFDMVRLDTRPEFEFTSGDLNPLVGKIVDLYIPKATKKTLKLRFVPGADLPAVPLDADEFARVVRNLLENAIYYTSGGGDISVKTYLENERTVLEVKDTGIGIAESDLPHVFERFYRADKARSTETGGSGLGLAIAQKIVEAHQGRIEAMSILGQGSTFRVVFPIRGSPTTNNAP